LFCIFSLPASWYNILRISKGLPTFAKNQLFDHPIITMHRTAVYEAFCDALFSVPQNKQGRHDSSPPFDSTANNKMQKTSPYEPTQLLFQ